MAGLRPFFVDERTGISRNVAVKLFFDRVRGDGVNHLLSIQVVIMSGVKRAVAIQLDCFVAARLAKTVGHCALKHPCA